MAELSNSNKVDFLIVGAQKSGTTALSAYMRSHPEIYMFGNESKRRSAHYFSDENIDFKKKQHYEDYHALFEPGANHKVIGECTPIYMYWNNAISRIWHYNPSIKLIAILRNPIERAYSAWNMERDRGAEQLTFRQALKREEERCRTTLPNQHRIFSYIDRGYYTSQIREIWRCIPRENTLFIKSDSLKKDHQNILNEAFSFLNVSPHHLEVEKNIHSRKYQSKMELQDFEFLKDKFEFEIKSLEHILNWDCASWLSYAEFTQKPLPIPAQSH